ncbi:Ig-like domain-containing protein, partial [Rubripirellula amarantea]|nr:Ig-like domain-containing protein [Rubripirellula amarantea]
DDVSLEITGSTMTMEAWVNPAAYNAGSGSMVMNREGEYEIGISDTGMLRWAFDNTDPNWAWHDTGYVVPLNEWSHLAVSYDNGVVSTYVNGVLVDVYEGSGAITDANAPMDNFIIGGRQNNPTGQYFNGQIDDVRIWDVARTQSEILTNINQDLTPQAGLLGNWQFNETSGTIAADSGGSNDGTLVDGGSGAAGPQWTYYTTDQDTVLNIAAGSGVLANDVDSDGDTLTVTQVEGSGVNVGAATTLASGATVTVTSTGSFDYNPNDAFNHLTPGQTGTDSFTYQVSDGNGGTSTATAYVTVTGDNDAPTLDNSANFWLDTISEDDAGNSGNTIAEIIASDGGDRITDADGDSEGIAIFSTSGTNGTWQFNTGSGWTDIGTVAVNSSLLLRSTDSIRFNPNGQNGEVAIISFAAWDQTTGTAGSKVDASSFGGNTAFSEDTDSANITVTAVNDAPVMTPYAPTYSTTENSAPFGAPVSTLLGSSVSDVDSGAVEGIAVYNSTGSVGTLEYSVNGGSSWQTFNSLSATNALLLRATDLFRYTPDGMNGGTMTLDYYAWDQTSGTAGSSVDVTTRGGTTAFSSVDDTVTINVTDINDEQVVSTNDGATFDEGSSSNTISQAMLETTDADNTTSEIIYSVTGSPSYGQLMMDGMVATTFTQADINSGRLSYDHDGTENFADSFSFSVDDGTGTASTGSFSITLNPVNDQAVVITSNGGGATASVNVNETISFVTQVTVSDGDLPGDTMTYSIIGGADQNDFAIDSSGNLTFVSPPDFENPDDGNTDNVYTVTIQVSDGIHTDAQAFTITVADVQGSTLTVTTTSDVDDTGLGASYTIEELYAVGGGSDGFVSLREAITAANNTLGQDTINFAILNTDAGYTGTDGVDAYWQISLTAALPTITESVILDGTSQTTFGGNVNPGTLGAVSEVGVNDQAISDVERPEIAIVGASGFSGLVVYSDDVTIQGFSMYGFSSANAIFIENGYQNTLIDSNVFGVSPTGIADPGAALNSQMHVHTNGADNGVLSNNILAYSTSTGFYAGNGSDGWTITGNQFINSGYNHINGDAIAMGGSTGGTIDGNYITGSSTQAIILSGSTTGVTISDNTIVGNAVGPISGTHTQYDAIAFRSGTNDITVSQNIIANNYGAGITVNNGAYGIEITQNSIYGNGTILSLQGSAASGIVGLDLQGTGEDVAQGTAPYYTANDADDVDTGGNSLQNFPVIDFASSDGSQLAVSGSFNSLAGRTYRLEFFLSDVYANGHGQGETYLGSIDVTTDGSGNATFITTLTATIPTGMQVTATATDLTTKETSEFSQQFAINDAPHILGQNAITNAQFTTDLSDWSATGDVDWQSSEARFGQLGGAAGVLSQTFTTEVGKEYFLTFEYGDRSATKSQSLQVDVNGSASLLAEAITSGVAEDALQLYTYSFVADSTSTTLTFTDTSADHSGVRGYIDSVEVRTDSTPLAAIDYTENDGAVQINNGFNFADVDDSNLESAVISITGNYTDGEDVLAFTNTANITGVWDSGTGTLTLTGTDTLANYEAALRSITYTDTSDDPSTSTRTVSFTVNDGDEDSNVSTRDIDVTAVNDAPVLDNTNNLTLTTQAEDDGPPVGAVGTSIDSLVDLQGGGGNDNVTDPDASQLGIALTGTDTTNGTWWYSQDNGTNWTAVGSVSDSSALLLNANSNTRIYFESNADYNGTISDAITFRAWDRTSGSPGNTVDASSNGGTTAFSTDTETADLTVTSVNDIPTISTGFDTFIGDFGGSTSNSILGKGTIATNNWIAIDPSQTYDISATAFSGDGAGGNYDPSEVHYLGFFSYDIDGNQITSMHTGRHAGAVDTTLAVDLVAGATQIVLSDATGWYEGSSLNNRSFAWYGYTNDLGETYADYTYTRNTITNLWDQNAIDHATGIITLRTPWAGPTILAGEAVRNMSPTGGTYQYPLASALAIDETGATFTTTLGGGFDSGATSQTLFRHGTAYISPLVLANFTSTSNQLNVSDFTIETNQGTTVFTEDGGPIAIIDTDFAITDNDDIHAESVTISLTNGKAGDILHVNEAAINALGISVAGIPAGELSGNGTITLTLTSNVANSVTFADYQNAINEITFENTSDDPDTTDRTMTFVVNDGDNDSATETLVIKVHEVDDAPVVSVTADSPTWAESGPVGLFSDASIDLVEAGEVVQSIVLTVDDIGNGSDERLIIDGESFRLLDLVSGVTDTNGYQVSVSVTGSQATVTITKSGGISAANAETLINAVAYDNLSDAPTGTTRTVTLQSVTESDIDGVNDTTTSVASVVTIADVNDAPEFVGPELITNGTFDTNLTGWTTTGATINLGPGELNFGGGDVAGPHTASQTIATEAGQTYRLTFDYRDGSTTKTQSLQVTVDGSSNLLTTSQIVTDIDGNTFVRYEYTFTADSSASTLTFTDTSDTAGVADGTAAVDGKVDNVSVKQIDGLLGTVGFTEGGSAVVLDTDVTLFDAEIEGGLDNYDNTTLTIVRNGGASGFDVFTATGNLDPLTEGGALVLNSQTVGTVDVNSAGTLTLRFNSSTNQAIINEVLQSIAYENTNNDPTSSIQLNWSFADNNIGAQQGTGGEQIATGYTVVNITSENDAPTVDVSTGQTVSEGGGIILSPDNLSSSDTDNDNSTLVYTVDSGLANGFLALSTAKSTPVTTFTQAQLDAGQVIYFHDGSDTTSDSFNFTVSDGSLSDTGTFNLTVDPVNDASVAVDDSNAFTVNEDGSQNFNVLGNDTDSENDTLTVTHVDGQTISIGQTVSVTDGSVRLEADGTLTFTPTADYNGTISFEYSISDRSNASGAAGQSLLLETNSGSATLLFSIDLDSGEKTLIGYPAFDTTSMSYDSASDTVYFITNAGGLYSWDPGTPIASTTLIGNVEGTGDGWTNPVPGAYTHQSSAFYNGSLYILPTAKLADAATDDALYRVDFSDPTTISDVVKVADLTGNAFEWNNNKDIVIDASTGMLYGRADHNGAQRESILFSYDLNDGTYT